MNSKDQIREILEKHFHPDDFNLDGIVSEFSKWHENRLKIYNSCDWLSPVPKEKKFQEEVLKKIFPAYPNGCPKWQYMNALLAYTAGQEIYDNEIKKMEENG